MICPAGVATSGRTQLSCEELQGKLDPQLGGFGRGLGAVTGQVHYCRPEARPPSKYKWSITNTLLVWASAHFSKWVLAVVESDRHTVRSNGVSVPNDDGEDDRLQRKQLALLGSGLVILGELLIMLLHRGRICFDAGQVPLHASSIRQLAKSFLVVFLSLSSSRCLPLVASLSLSFSRHSSAACSAPARVTATNVLRRVYLR